MRCLSPSIPVLPLCVALFLCSGALLPTRADVTIGGSARAVAMGGAGLASGAAEGGTALNPALLAEATTQGIEWPTIDSHMNGQDYTDAFALLGSPRLHANTAFTFARDLGTQPDNMSASARMGLMLVQSELTADAALRVKILPNDAYQQWATAGGVMPAGAQADVVGVGLSDLPSIGLGLYLPSSSPSAGALAIGLRLRRTQIYYSHYVVDAAALAAGRPSVGAEMLGRDSLRSTSFAADLGFTYTPPTSQHFRMAFVVNNLVQPEKLAIADPLPAFLPNGRQMAPRTFNLGTALVDQNVTFAADLCDLTNALGDGRQARIGLELITAGGIALRGGYNSSFGLTYGLGWNGFGIAFTRQMPVLISQTMNF